MSHISDLTPDSPSDPSPDRTENHGSGSTAWQLPLLRELAEMGMDVARKSHRQVMNQTDEATENSQPALAFARVSRVLHQGMALYADLAEETRIRNENDRRRAEARAESAAAEFKTRRINEVDRLVKEVIAAAYDSATEDEADRDVFDYNPYSHLRGKLTDRNETEDFAVRPVSQLVERICRDMDLTPNWNAWANRDWAMEEIRTKPPGSPYAAWLETTSGSDPPL